MTKRIGSEYGSNLRFMESINRKRFKLGLDTIPLDLNGNPLKERKYKK